MTIRDAFRHLFGRTRDGPTGDPTFWMSNRIRGLLAGGLTDPFVTPHIFAAVTAITSHLQSVDFTLYTGREDDKRPVLAGPWYDFFASPSSELTRIEFWARTWQLTQMERGESFWILYGRQDLVERNEIPVEAQVMPGSDFVEKRADNGRLDHWLFKPAGTGAGQPLQLHQVVQFAPIRDPKNHLRGVSPLAASMRDVRTDDKAAKFSEALLENGARPDGLLTTDQEITQDQATDMRTRWNDAHRGYGKAGRIGVLGHGAKFQDVTIKHKDMEYHQQREWSRAAVAEVFGVPLMFFGVLDDLHKETSRQVRKLFWETKLIPMLIMGEALLEARLFEGRMAKGGDVWGEFDLSGIESLQEEEGARRENATKDRSLGIPLNEVIVRHDLGYVEQGPSGDVGLVPFSVQTTDAAAATFDEEEPAAPTPPPPLPEEPDEDSTEDEEDEARAPTLITTRDDRDPKRRAMWEQYVRGVQRPGEKAMLRRLRGWMRGRRADTLKAIEKMDSGRKADATGLFVGTVEYRSVSKDSMDAWLLAQHDRWHDMLDGQTKSVTKNVVRLTLDRLGDQLGGLETVDMKHPRILEFMEEQGAQKVRVVDTIQKDIRRTMLDGLSEGENLTDLQNRVRKTFNVANARSLAIARTESASASQGSKFVAMEAEGVKEIVWLSAEDSEVRTFEDGGFNHLIDGEAIPIGGTFSNGLRYPHDPEGEAGNVINCRCEAIPEV